MKKEIISKLRNLEKSHDIKIIYSCESGSRAWGFESFDSDYDIRFVYVKRPHKYITVFPDNRTMDRGNIESIRILLNNTDYDIVGWDITKTVYLMGAKGNPDVISWLYSPIKYYYKSCCYELLKNIAQEYFRTKSALYHYLHMAKGNFNQYIKNHDEVILKKYLYVLRPLMACIHIDSYKVSPPMRFNDMLHFVPEKEREQIEALLLKKKSGEELGSGPNNSILTKYCENIINYFNNRVEKTEISNKTVEEWDKLDSDLRKIIQKSWPVWKRII